MKFVSVILAALMIALVSRECATAADVALPAAIKSRGHLNVGVYCDYPPFGFTNASGQPQGIEVDYAKQLAQYAFGSPSALRLTCVKAASRIPYLQTDKVDIVIAALGITQARAKVIDFSEPFFASTSVFLALKGHPFSTFSQLKGKTLIITSGTPWITWLQGCEPGINLGQYSTTTDDLEALNAGRGVAFLDDSTLLYPIAAKNPNYIITGPNVKEQGYSWAMGVKKGNKPLLDWVNAQIDKMQAGDAFYKTLGKWIKDPQTLKALSSVTRRPGQTPDYHKYQASYSDKPPCPAS